jgi:sirohydrochlorin cobaltochelatase
MPPPATQDDFAALDFRLHALLPEHYRDPGRVVQPTSMGSAALKYDEDGKVAWQDIWGSFCDLAMAGGPPHKGSLLEPATPAEIADHAESYVAVATEICRGITAVTGLTADLSPVPGWVRIFCKSAAMAGWLTRAIVMENVSAASEGMVLYLPAGPCYRLSKEVKNCHYWLGHMSEGRHRTISRLLLAMHLESPLLQPPFANLCVSTKPVFATRVANQLQQSTGLRPILKASTNWVGLDCHDIHPAIWMMRALIASNVLSRREETVVFLPINPATDPSGAYVTRLAVRACRLATSRGVFDRPKVLVTGSP